MRDIIFICVIVLLSACSMVPNQNTQHSTSIRIIKEQPKRYEYERKYNTKIEQVNYNSSIIEPEINKNSQTVRIKNKTYNNKLPKRITGKVSSTVSSKTNQVESKAGNIMNKTIDRGIDSLFR